MKLLTLIYVEFFLQIEMHFHSYSVLLVLYDYYLYQSIFSRFLWTAADDHLITRIL